MFRFYYLYIYIYINIFMLSNKMVTEFNYQPEEFYLLILK